MDDLIDTPTILDVPDLGTGAANATTDWPAILASSTVTAEELQRLPIKPRAPILDQWFLESDLGYIFAPRGLGKTWLAMHFAQAIASGGKAGPWAADKPRRVLYTDGEMALDLTQKRHRALAPTPHPNLSFLHHELVFQRNGKVLNLTAPLIQESLLQYTMANQIEVLFLDNLSCLFSGVKENDADAWELILPWLLQLRRHRIAVVFVAHAGRNGFMRGTSRREDAAVWIIALEEAVDASLSKAPKSSGGARFVTRFTKCRNTPGEEVPMLEWHFQRSGLEGVSVHWSEADPLAIFRGWVEDGLDSCGDIALEMQLSKGQVSKLARRAQQAGWLTLKGRRYILATPDSSRLPYAD